MRPTPTSSSTATIAQGLVAFPQYSGVTDTWGGNSGNFSYHSFQITLMQRIGHGLSFNVNYTYSKNIGDDGTFRSGFDIPAAAISGGGKNWHQDRIERSWTTVSAPQALHAFGVYELPFGKGHLGNNSIVVRYARRRLEALRHLHLRLRYAGCRHLQRMLRHQLPRPGPVHA